MYAGDWVRDEGVSAFPASAVPAAGFPGSGLATPPVPGGTWIRRLTLAVMLVAAAWALLVALAGPAAAAPGQPTDDAVEAVLESAAVPLTDHAVGNPGRGPRNDSGPPASTAPEEIPGDTSAGTRDAKPGAANDRGGRAPGIDAARLPAPVAVAAGTGRAVAATTGTGRAVPAFGHTITELPAAAAGAPQHAAKGSAGSVPTAIVEPLQPDTPVVPPGPVPAAPTLGAGSSPPPAAAQAAAQAAEGEVSPVWRVAGISAGSAPLVKAAAGAAAPAPLADRAAVLPSAPALPAGSSVPPLVPLPSGSCLTGAFSPSAGGSGHGQDDKALAFTVLSGSTVPAWTEARATSVSSGNVVRGAQNPGTRPG